MPTDCLGKLLIQKNRRLVFDRQRKFAKYIKEKNHKQSKETISAYKNIFFFFYNTF